MRQNKVKTMKQIARNTKQVKQQSNMLNYTFLAMIAFTLYSVSGLIGTLSLYIY